MTEPIQIWRFGDAPPELQYRFAGGDEDFIVLIPPDADCPFQLENLGCCDNKEFEISESGEFMQRLELGGDFKWKVEPTGFQSVAAAAYAGYRVIISCHS